MANIDSNVLSKIVQTQKRGEARGIYSVCSAHPLVLRAAMQQALADGFVLLIESTCNQVNQFGGYMGMRPMDFMNFVQSVASKAGFPSSRLILGGDHLGPSVWQNEPAEMAMRKAVDLVREYVRAGYSKIHLDASMLLGDDLRDRKQDIHLIALREAQLCQVAEETYGSSGSNSSPLHYVIGTEVPIPGGEIVAQEALKVSSVDETRETWEVTREEFSKIGLDEAWRRVIALVVQPGVEFGDTVVFDYQRTAADGLKRLCEEYDQFIYEAHSTDYQPAWALQQLVEDHFAILKVGPALTFAMREALFALAMLENEWLIGKPGVHLSSLIPELEKTMQLKPIHWEKYYQGDGFTQLLARKYSYSDRSRYYWAEPEVKTAIQTLFENLNQNPPPLTLISQFFPDQYWQIREGLLENKPEALVSARIRRVLQDYANACGYGSSGNG